MSLTVKTLMEVKRFDKDCMLNYHKWCPFCLTDDHYKALPLCLHITSNRVDRRGFSLIFGKNLSPTMSAIKNLLPSRKRRSGSDHEIEIGHREHKTEASDAL